MDQSGNALLLRFINSQHFNLYYCISYLQRYSDNIGVHHYLCEKVKTYPIEELKFFIPQFLQLIITVETDSMALEEMIKDLCTSDVHFSLITFWHLQSSLQELSTQPNSTGFQVCKRILNDVQFQLFSLSPPNATVSSRVGSSGIVYKNSQHAMKQFRENVSPSAVLISSVLSSAAFPQLGKSAEHLVRTQGKLSRSFVFQIAKGLQQQMNENLTMKNTRLNAELSSHTVENTAEQDASQTEKPYRRAKSLSLTSLQGKRQGQLDQHRKHNEHSENLDFSIIDKYAETNLPHLNRAISNPNMKRFKNKRLSQALDVKQSVMSDLYPLSPEKGYDNLTLKNLQRLRSESQLNNDSITASMPELHPTHTNSTAVSEVESLYDSGNERSPTISLNGSYKKQSVKLSIPQKIKVLKNNYFKCETQFVIALQNISIKLSHVPKETRLACLRAELTLMNKDLPCEIDVPLLLPKGKSGKLHKIVNIPANEAAVLNSAERVPYLLLIEYVSSEIDFSPESKENKQLLEKLNDNGSDVNGDSKRYVFDLAGIMRASDSRRTNDYGKSLSPLQNGEMPLEADLADLSIVNLSNRKESEFLKREQFVQAASEVPILEGDSPLRQDVLNFQSHYETDSLTDKSDFATQMRIAAVMLSQLDSSTSHLPMDQAGAIKARIVSSMQSLQHEFGVKDLQDINTEAGERKFSNDLKVAGVKSNLKNKNDYYLGEDWNSKKERIRKQSPYGHLEHWNLCSVIAKTGDDLTQEAFACQLIQSMSTVWHNHGVNIWVKRMRILVTSNSTGLVETITDAVSIHSIKKSLTEYLIENNEDHRGAIATLLDHFRMTFGDPNSARYRKAQNNFAISLAAYSVICYILQIKDRHNGNIMLDNEGHIIHIDFGFLLSNSPGSVGFEAAPFKLTLEYVDVLGGLDGEYFQVFKQSTKEAFKSLRRNAESLITMVELMQRDSTLPCFKAGENTSVQLRQRLQLHLSEEDSDYFVENFLIGKSIGSIYTKLYDQFQLLTQGIYS
ncbi:BA75_00675T0 [Komagataella pastoris]|uniref:1-phosphatidylinositol 4-kinase n=1 Tax=Komagataella pastoris TaxID=4922 RepID=A0A1B2J9V5_PICPA|nr:BA75_00675T0 [Komagataella pastoris]